ncbi:hypothetical protein GQ607_016907 [Colletotrichum asianum]|uniref:F-box domain-containing protein n=1 Tax=Colletotrichum asianum TaxID=702518 RepID=A0A8H3VUX2_9PEZI|nr:hypothetical protein GQ607_016907 [Colletotrichum asianum]
MLINQGIKRLFSPTSLSLILIATSTAAARQAPPQIIFNLQNSFQSFRTMTSSIASWSSPRQRSRIRIVQDRDDIEAIYPLLASYALTPDSASSVTEFAIDPAGWPSGSSCFFGDPDAPLTEPAKPVDEAAHALLESRARDLGLSEKTTQVMLRSLAWKKAHLLAQKPESPKGFVKHNKLYAEVAAVLLLSYTRYVTHLLVGNLEWTPLLKEYLKKSNYALIPADYRAFPQLETVEVVDLSWKDDERQYYSLEILDYLHYFHRLPSFRNLILDGTGEYQMEKLLFPAGTSSPSFKRIQARCTDISGGVLGMLLRAPKGLEEVVVSIGGLWSMDGGSPIVQLKTIGKCLLTQKETLRVLDLDLENGIHARESEEEAGMEDYSLDEEGEEVIGVTEATLEKDEYFLLAEAEATGPLLPHRIPDTRKYGYTIGSFHDFEALTHLSINVQALMGPNDGWEPPYKLKEEPPFQLVDALPPSLEYLCLYGYRKGENFAVDSHVKELLEKKAERLPRLAEIRGVEETVLGEGASFGGSPEEDDLYQGKVERIEYVRSWGA